MKLNTKHKCSIAYNGYKYKRFITKTLIKIKIKNNTTNIWNNKINVLYLVI